MFPLENFVKSFQQSVELS